MPQRHEICVWRVKQRWGRGARKRAATLSIIQSQLSAVWRHCYSRSLLIALYFTVENALPQPTWCTTMSSFHPQPPHYSYLLLTCFTVLSLKLTFSLSLFLSRLCLALQFDKAYAYSVRHMFGKEGKRTDYTPYSCMKVILSNPPSQGDYHGESYWARLLVLNAIGPPEARL